MMLEFLKYRFIVLIESRGNYNFLTQEILAGDVEVSQKLDY